MPLGRVLAEFDVPFAAPIAQKNISVWQRGEPLTLSRDTHANTEALTVVTARTSRSSGTAPCSSTLAGGG